MISEHWKNNRNAIRYFKNFRFTESFQKSYHSCNKFWKAVFLSDAIITVISFLKSSSELLWSVLEDRSFKASKGEYSALEDSNQVKLDFFYFIVTEGPKSLYFLL